MRLYSMYFLCKNNIMVFENLVIQTRTLSGSQIRYISNWLSIVKILNKLSGVPCLKSATTALYESIPTMLRDQDQFDFDNTTYSNFVREQRNLISRMNTVIDLYESSHNDQPYALGFDIKLPDFTSLKEVSQCMRDLDFITSQCPYLMIPDSEIKYKSVDIGSFWITFFVVGSAATTILLNLSKIVEAATRIKSQVITVKQQEEVLRSMEIKNEIASDMMDTFKIINKQLTDRCVKDLENEIGELKDGDELDRTGRSIERMAEWLAKGMQIYSAIDAPSEVKTLFPQQEEQPLLKEDVIKLLELKAREENKSE